MLIALGAAIAAIATSIAAVGLLETVDYFLRRGDDPHVLHPMPNSKEPEECEACRARTVQEKSGRP